MYSDKPYAQFSIFAFGSFVLGLLLHYIIMPVTIVNSFLIGCVSIIVMACFVYILFKLYGKK